MVVLAVTVALEHRCEAAPARLNEIAQFLIPVPRRRTGRHHWPVPEYGALDDDRTVACRSRLDAFHVVPDELPGRTLERCLFAHDGIKLLDVRGSYKPFSWTSGSISQRWGVVLVRHGLYHRRYDGDEHVVDVNTGFVRRPGQETALAIPNGLPDDLTSIDVDEAALDLVPVLTEASGPLRITPRVSLAHRLLCKCVTAGEDDVAVEAAIGDVLTSALGDNADRPVYTRTSTERTHQRAVLQTCELLQVADPGMSLVELARHVAVSPFHLTKIFRRVTGTTISQYRTRLLVHAVLERICDGDDDLSSIAASTGFADHSHMTRTLVSQLGHTPSALRELLRHSVLADQPVLDARSSR